RGLYSQCACQVARTSIEPKPRCRCRGDYRSQKHRHAIKRVAALLVNGVGGAMVLWVQSTGLSSTTCRPTAPCEPRHPSDETTLAGEQPANSRRRAQRRPCPLSGKPDIEPTLPNDRV